MAEPHLKRNITFFETVAIVVGLVIGSGIFLKPAAVLIHSGSSAAAILAWLVAGLLTLCAALSISEISARIPLVGGLYSYLTELYGDIVGFLNGWAKTMISSPGSSAAMAIAFVTLSTSLIRLSPAGQKALAVLLIAFIVGAQIIATKFGVFLQTAATIGKLIPVGAIIGFGLIKGRAHDLNFAALSGIEKGAGFGLAMLGALWAYDGWINAATLGEEIIEPEKKLPRGIIAGVLIVMAVYTLFNIALFNVLPASKIAISPKAGVDASLALFGSWGMIFITIGMMISIFGALNGQIMAGTRTAFAMGQRKRMPYSEFLGALHPRLSTPVSALVFQGVLSILFVLSGTFETITNIVIFVLWIFYTLGVAAVFRLRKKFRGGNKSYSVPLYPLTPILGILGGAFLMYNTIKVSFSGSMLGIALTLLGLPVYFYCRKKARAAS